MAKPYVDAIQKSATAATYPPYNIKRTDKNTYVIEMALAGFSKQEIEIELDGDKLYIKGAVNKSVSDMVSFIYKGIANRSFAHMFMLNDRVEVKNATMLNGMLRIMLERMTPEQNKVKKVDITDGDEASTVTEFASNNLYKTGEQVFGPGSK
jgi:molecular chaperone IbpA